MSGEKRTRSTKRCAPTRSCWRGIGLARQRMWRRRWAEGKSIAAAVLPAAGVWQAVGHAQLLPHRSTTAVRSF